jgi:hypothetical protein
MSGIVMEDGAHVQERRVSIVGEPSELACVGVHDCVQRLRHVP